MHAKKILTVILTAVAGLTTGTPAKANLVVLSGSLDNLQVVAPVEDSLGNVIGSTSIVNGHPASTSTATGYATVTIDTGAKTITTDFTWAGLSGPADRAHLHDAPTGVTRLLDPPNNRFFHEVIRDESISLQDQVDCAPTDPTDGFGPVVATNCAPTFGSLHDFLQLDDTWFDPTGQLQFPDFDTLLHAFETDGMFLDIHTELYPGGEIRGQLLFNATPEPATLALLTFGLFGLLASRHRKRA